MNGWEGLQGSGYVGCFDGETWTTFRSSESFPGGFLLDTLTTDGLLWGTTSDGRLVSFDGGSWSESESWTSYEFPGVVQDHVGFLAVAPDGALWLATGGSAARLVRNSSSDEAWTIYDQDDGLPESTYHALAFGTEGEIWFGATRYRPARQEATAKVPAGSPQLVETTTPIVASQPEGLSAPYCRPGEASLQLSVPTTWLEVGQFLTVTLTLINGDESDAQLGQIQYSLSVQPDTLVSGNLELVQHPLSIGPGNSDQALFVLRAVEAGKLRLSGSASYEIHALDYSWASWSGCQSHGLEVSISPQ